MFWLYDPTYLILIPAMILVFWAQAQVRSAFAQWSRVRTRSGVTAADVARDILAQYNLSDIPVEYVHGQLTDHYDPQSRVVRLSSSTYNSTSIAAIAVAAHEVGHAIQHDTSYLPLNLRNLVFPVARIGDTLGPFLVVLGIMFMFVDYQLGMGLIDIGILAFSAAVLFYLVTLPVEFDASRRALVILEGGGYLTRDELRGARTMLRAAAMTYVAAAATALSQLLRLLFIRSLARDD